jgi:hypothetical protein
MRLSGTTVDLRSIGRLNGLDVELAVDAVPDAEPW